MASILSEKGIAHVEQIRRAAVTMARNMTNEGFDYEAIQICLMSRRLFDPLFCHCADVEDKILAAQAIIRDAENSIPSSN